jgi:sec-independent protein translocase protein TatA
MSEMIFIFVLALLIFGPKKLPELGKTLGRAMTEFRRASSELKSTFDREMSNLERETASTTKELNSGFNYNNSSYNYESSPYDPDSYSAGYHETNPYIASASATQGAQLTAATPEVDGSMFVSALEGNTTHPSEPPKSEPGANGTSGSHPAVQG